MKAICHISLRLHYNYTDNLSSGHDCIDQNKQNESRAFSDYRLYFRVSRTDILLTPVCKGTVKTKSSLMQKAFAQVACSATDC